MHIPIGAGRVFVLPDSYAPGDEHWCAHVPAEWVEVQGYIPPHWARVNHRHRLAIGDVERKYESIWQIRQQFPEATPSAPPKGVFQVEGDGRLVFVVTDGSHRFFAAYMLSPEPILVRWNWPLSNLTIL